MTTVWGPHRQRRHAGLRDEAGAAGGIERAASGIERAASAAATGARLLDSAARGPAVLTARRPGRTIQPGP